MTVIPIRQPNTASRQADALAEINRLQAERADRIIRLLGEAGADMADYVACPLGKPGLQNAYSKFAPALASFLMTASAIGGRS